MDGNEGGRSSGAVGGVCEDGGEPRERLVGGVVDENVAVEEATRLEDPVRNVAVGKRHPSLGELTLHTKNVSIHTVHVEL